jgi:hypothetical protein
VGELPPIVVVLVVLAGVVALGVRLGNYAERADD